MGQVVSVVCDLNPLSLAKSVAHDLSVYVLCLIVANHRATVVDAGNSVLKVTRPMVMTKAMVARGIRTQPWHFQNLQMFQSV